jgi:hypothetical protein
MQAELNKFSRLGSPRTGADKQMNPTRSAYEQVYFNPNCILIEPGCMRRSGRVVGHTEVIRRRLRDW